MPKHANTPWYEVAEYANEYLLTNNVFETENSARHAADQASEDLSHDQDIGSWHVYYLTHQCAQVDECECVEWVGEGRRVHPNTEPYRSS